MKSESSSELAKLPASTICPRSYDALRLPDVSAYRATELSVNKSTRIERIVPPRFLAKFFDGTRLKQKVSHASSQPRAGTSRISLSDLPNEILLSVADLISQHELDALARTSRNLHQRLDPYLYQRDMKIDGIRTCFWAINENRTIAVRKLLDAGLDPNARETWSYRRATPLLWAALYGRSLTAALLIERGADIELEDYRGYTPFQLAIERGHETVVQVLIASGVNGGHTNFDKYGCGCTALHVASYLGYPGIVKLLLDAGEDIGAQDSRGLTPLHWATKPSFLGWSHGRTAAGVSEAMTVLLDHGANLDARDDDDLRPVAYVRTHWDDELKGIFRLYQPFKEY